MTAEIVIMNREAIAVAADSTVTLHQGKTFQSVNKIFSLSKYHPVGVMIYENPLFMGIPWETIIKTYRKMLGETSFETLDEYVDSFLSFVRDHQDLFSEEARDQYLRQRALREFDDARIFILRKSEGVAGDVRNITKTEMRRLVNSCLVEWEEMYKEATPYSPTVAGYTQQLTLDYRDLVQEVATDVFEDLPLTKTNLDRMLRIFVLALTQYIEGNLPDFYTGIVFMGFGEKEYFPAFSSYLIEGLLYDSLLFQEGVSGRINHETSAQIMPFAQGDMVVQFMEGFDRDFREKLLDDFKELLLEYPAELISQIDEIDRKRKNELKKTHMTECEQLFDSYVDDLQEFKRLNYIDPVMNIVSSLPKDELAGMAESLVNLTSLKTRVTEDIETVGGPIDVAVLSKGDGFIWIKRKHYFEPRLNQAFLNNYFRET